jgi:hypothetical protein
VAVGVEFFARDVVDIMSGQYELEVPETRGTPIICHPYHILDIKSAVGDEGN